MLPYRDGSITKIFLSIFFIVVIGYAFFEAHGILFGPSISLSQPSIEATSSPSVDLRGTAARIAQLLVNGDSVPVTQDGAFDVPYALAPGYNRIVLDAQDKYGKSAEQVVEIVYTPGTSTPATAAATSTAATSTPPAASSTERVAP